MLPSYSIREWYTPISLSVNAAKMNFRKGMSFRPPESQLSHTSKDVFKQHVQTPGFQNQHTPNRIYFITINALAPAMGTSLGGHCLATFRLALLAGIQCGSQSAPPHRNNRTVSRWKVHPWFNGSANRWSKTWILTELSSCPKTTAAWWIRPAWPTPQKRWDH